MSTVWSPGDGHAETPARATGADIYTDFQATDTSPDPNEWQNNVEPGFEYNPDAMTRLFRDRRKR